MSAPDVKRMLSDVPEGACGHCEKWRPLWKYRPQHEGHLHEPDALSCTWCQREEQPVLCARCYQGEYERELDTPTSETETALWQMIARNDAILEARERAAS